MTTTTHDRTGGLRRHPVRGLLWGALAGLGLALMLIDRSVIALGRIAPFLLIAGGAVVGLIWAYLAPPRRSASSTRPEG